MELKGQGARDKLKGTRHKVQGTSSQDSKKHQESQKKNERLSLPHRGKMSVDSSQRFIHCSVGAKCWLTRLIFLFQDGVFC